MKRLLGISVFLLFTILLVASGCAQTPAAGEAKATFVVSWYDVGAAALEGRPGVISVERGWKGFSEVNRVIYDPGKVDRTQMEQWLRDAGTYIRTVPEPAGNKNRSPDREQE